MVLEYDELTEAVESYKDKFESVTIAEPLLEKLGTVTMQSMMIKSSSRSHHGRSSETAGYDSLEVAEADGNCICIHGDTELLHCKDRYSQMQSQMNDLGYGQCIYRYCRRKPKILHVKQ